MKTKHQNLRNADKTELRKKHIGPNVYMRKEMSQVTDLSFCFEKLQKEQIKSKESRCQ